MKFRAEIDIMPMEEILDPQGKVVNAALHNLGLEGIGNVRIGKHIRLAVDASSREEAAEAVEVACKKLLANLIMERFSYRLEPMNEG